MPEITIKSAAENDVQLLTALDHSYQTDYVWQMDRIMNEGESIISFREIRLPRTVKVDYPHSIGISQDGLARSQVLVAYKIEQLCGYARIEEQIANSTVWITDIVVDAKMRRQGIGSALLVAVQKWAHQRRLRKIVLEMQSKNYPAIRFAIKSGYQFSGFHDHHYSNQDIALHFDRLIR